MLMPVDFFRIASVVLIKRTERRMNPVTTLVLLADESKARLLENRGVNKGLTQIGVVDAADFEDTHVRYADTPGRSRSAPNAAAHAVDRTTSERAQNRNNFARHVVQAAEKLWAKGSFDRFVVAAPPNMLGAVRQSLDGALADNLAFDLSKDLMDIPLKNLPTYFDDQIVF